MGLLSPTCSRERKRQGRYPHLTYEEAEVKKTREFIGKIAEPTWKCCPLRVSSLQTQSLDGEGYGGLAVLTPKAHLGLGSIQGEEKAWRTKNNRTIKKDAALTETVYGEMQGTVHRLLLEERQSDLKAGSVLLLKQVGVFSPSHRNHYLNVTPNNLVKIYLPESGDGSPLQLSQEHGEMGDRTVPVSSEVHSPAEFQQDSPENLSGGASNPRSTGSSRRDGNSSWRTNPSLGGLLPCLGRHGDGTSGSNRPSQEEPLGAEACDMGVYDRGYKFSGPRVVFCTVFYSEFGLGVAVQLEGAVPGPGELILRRVDHLRLLFVGTSQNWALSQTR
ncbi:Putative protein C17orf53 [Chelonia mydas]|uniref:Homologous recombination OB-fold protein OB-fold domain-containing protein n=1 Tax=Chelonia mydas TaxID=8469 RepID=M7BDR9_CHEMY|nr:Putative protein C17orf53 [Chelonia mydas]